MMNGHSTPLSPLSYRADLDGLRAVAIILVMIEHLFRGFGLVSGGLGVDMFFVLSGYLITRILVKELAQGTFSFRNFYTRRIRRLFPTVLLAFVVALIAGWWLLSPYGFRLLGGTVAASGTGTMNCVLSFGLPFFHIDPKLLPFGQLWSLAIEEQFYLLFPVLLLGMNRVSFLIRWRIHILVLLACVSWTYHYMFKDIWGETYYNPVARSWELLIGVLLALSGDQCSVWLRKAGLVCQAWAVAGRRSLVLMGMMVMASDMESDVVNLCFGLILMGAGVFLSLRSAKTRVSSRENRGVEGVGNSAASGAPLIHSDFLKSPLSGLTNTPATNTPATMVVGSVLIISSLFIGVVVPVCFSGILATVGTAFLITAGPDALVNKQFLSRPIMVYIGKISYALYVIHYPLMVLWGLVGGGLVKDPGVLWLIFFLSFPLAAFMYHGIEQPTRRAPYLWSWVVLMGVCVGVGYAGYSEKIMPKNHIENISDETRRIIV